MIVRNETDNLPTLFESVYQYIDYWVISDTGSTDGTPEMCYDLLTKKYGIPGEVVHHEWQGFGWNRQQALDAAVDSKKKGRHQCVWCFCIDADSELVIDDPEWTQSMDTNFSYSIISRFNKGSVTTSNTHLMNIESQNWEWRGPIHNYQVALLPNRQVGFLKGIWLKQDEHGQNGGKAKRFNGDLKKKYLNDAEVLVKHIGTNPDDLPRSLFYAANSYRDAGEPELAIEYYKKRIEVNGGWDQEKYVSATNYYSLLKDKNTKHAREILVRAIKWCPWRAEVFFNLTMHLRFHVSPYAALAISTYAIEHCKARDSDLISFPNMYEWGLLDQHSVNLCYADQFNRAVDTIQNKLLNQNVPDEQIARIEKNLSIALESSDQSVSIDTQDLGPWEMDANVLDWISSIFHKGSVILEFGSGAGSSRLAQHYKVHSVEHNAEWVDKFAGVTYHYATIHNGWYDPKGLKELPVKPDLIIIDGPPANIGRSGILDHLDLLNQNSIILINDTNRAKDKELADQICSHMPERFRFEIQGNGKMTTVLV